MEYILAALFIGALIFAYYQARLFVGMIRSLVGEICKIKTFALGVPKEEGVEPVRIIEPPSHPDFGLGEIVDDIEQAEREADEKLV
jgi:hypothetical protein